MVFLTNLFSRDRNVKFVLSIRCVYRVVTPIDLLMVKFTFYKRSNNLIVHLFAFRKTNGFSY
ncbi:hypothetical protein PDPUS_1_01038 [Photobacterium damselae subsp. piscicida]|uniref:Uncharacterized protein n=1 Tax=Photobacterium damsela subsp. piscicida TaxID=38294 RepID=A0AAD1CG24_PHODP|nr:hypothetical protein PDPUS_1_01038 [Photobacterium damselae subsp. piscicida]GAW44926.1 hypothetical protein PDPJ_1_02341 [Photobacterium damselae subsp. piscicida]